MSKTAGRYDVQVFLINQLTGMACIPQGWEPFAADGYRVYAKKWVTL